MAVIERGYAVGERIFSSAEIEDIRAGITDTIDRIARGFLSPYETSCSALPLEERLEQATGFSAEAESMAPRRDRSRRSLPNRTTAIRWNVVMWVKCDSSHRDE